MKYISTALRHMVGLALVALLSCAGAVTWLILLLAFQEGFEQPLHVYTDWLVKMLIPNSIRDGFLGNFLILLLIVFQQMGINKWDTYFKIPRILGMALVHTSLMYLIITPKIDISLFGEYIFTPLFVTSFVINSIITIALLGVVIKHFHLPKPKGLPIAVGSEAYGGNLENDNKVSSNFDNNNDNKNDNKNGEKKSLKATGFSPAKEKINNPNKVK